jgi:hypothetical protein
MSDFLGPAQHYVTALEAKLNECDRTDEKIDMLARPFPSRA